MTHPPKRFLRHFLLFAWICVLAGLPREAAARQETLLWQQVDLTNVAGFMVYVGSSSRNYETVIDVEMATAEGGDIFSHVLDVPNGDRVYVAVTAYSESGLESVFSNEQARAGGFPALVPILLYLLED